MEDKVDRRTLLGTAGIAAAFALTGRSGSAEAADPEKKSPAPMDMIPPELVKMAKEMVREATAKTQGLAAASDEGKVHVRLEIDYPTLNGRLTVQSKPSTFDWYADPNPSDPVRCD